MLPIVSGIEWVDRGNLKLEGGEVKEIYPLTIDDEKLQPENINIYYKPTINKFCLWTFLLFLENI